MKLLKYIPVAFLALMGFASCESDLDKVTYHPEDAVASTLNAVQSSYVLLEEKADQVVETFKWTEASFGYNAAITYRVEIDLAGSNFANKKVITSVVGKTEASVTYKELNDLILSLDTLYNITPGEKGSFQIRLSASIGESVTPLYSSIQSSDVTAYFSTTKPVVYIVGNGIKDVPTWSNDANAIGNGLQLFFSNTSKNTSLIYTYTGYFLAGKELKFPISAGDWDTGYAADGNDLKPNNAGENYIIPIASDGLYTLEIDTKALTIKMTPYTEAGKTYTTIGIVGDGANGWPSDDDVTDIAMTNPTPHIWVAKDVELTAAQIKFRANKAWDISWGAQSSSNQDLPYGLGKLGGENFQIKTAGKYYLALNDLTGHYVIIPMSDLPVKVDK